MEEHGASKCVKFTFKSVREYDAGQRSFEAGSKLSFTEHVGRNPGAAVELLSSGPAHYAYNDSMHTSFLTIAMRVLVLNLLINSSEFGVVYLNFGQLTKSTEN